MGPSFPFGQTDKEKMDCLFGLVWCVGCLLGFSVFLPVVMVTGHLLVWNLRLDPDLFWSECSLRLLGQRYFFICRHALTTVHLACCLKLSILLFSFFFVSSLFFTYLLLAVSYSDTKHVLLQECCFISSWILGLDQK